MSGRRVLFVNNLSSRTSADDLRYEFKRFGRLSRCDIPPTRRGAPYAFVEYEDPRDAQDAYKDMHERMISGTRIRVEWAKRAPSRAWRGEGLSAGGSSSSRGRSRSPPPRSRGSDRDRSPPPRRHASSRSPPPSSSRDRRSSRSPRRASRSPRRASRSRSPPPPRRSSPHQSPPPRDGSSAREDDFRRKSTSPTPEPRVRGTSASPDA